MAVKSNRWGGKQAYDPNTGKFASKSGAPSKKKFSSFGKKKRFSNFKKKI